MNCSFYLATFSKIHLLGILLKYRLLLSCEDRVVFSRPGEQATQENYTMGRKNVPLFMFPIILSNVYQFK